MAKRILLLDILGLLLLCLCFLMVDLLGAASPAPRWSKPNCRDHCGDIKIPFPFGIGRPDCFFDEWFEIDCKQNETIPFLKKLKLRVLDISFWTAYPDTDQYVTVSFPMIYSNPNCSPKEISQPPSLQWSPFFFTASKNIFAAVGCDNVKAVMNNSNQKYPERISSAGCKLECSGGDFRRNTTCSGFDNCCLTRLPSDLRTFNVSFISAKDATRTNDQQCNYALLANESWLRSSFTDLDSLKMEGYARAVLVWGISSVSDLAKDLSKSRYDPNANYMCMEYEYTDDENPLFPCHCRDGYDGNPFLIDGCQDIDECKEDPKICYPNGCVNTRGSYHCVDPRKTLKLVLIGFGSGLGVLLLVFLGWWLHRVIKKRREKKLKEKYFKRNGGLILQQQLLSSEGNIQRSKLFNQKEIKIATENFSESRILGKGGQGTVYKGMLTDGRIVAIKRALVMDEEKVEQFINEVMILTQISHRNIVQLLGCCLETEIPLLVYEFIPNGNLYEYLHGSSKEDLVPWEVRLQLAIEIAGAIYYLHSAASVPVYHRDIKSTNILLDEKYRPKIADFGTSRLVSLDQTHVTTLVQGTFGYFDPEYFQTNQFTYKSDVYSFGVVLVELLTRKKPLSTTAMEDGKNLAAYFLLAMEDGHLFDILDPKVLNQGTEEEILSVANLAKSCLHLHGKNRPTMREVTIELEGIKKVRHLPNI